MARTICPRCGFEVEVGDLRPAETPMEDCGRCGFRFVAAGILPEQDALPDVAAETGPEPSPAEDDAEVAPEDDDPVEAPAPKLRNHDPNQTELLIADGKPPYRIPTMREIEQTAPNGLKVVSTFSGCGGSCLGFRMAGYETLLAAEFIPAAVETYQANHPGVPVFRFDIRDFEPSKWFREIGLRRGDLDVLEGSPPCSPFSSAGSGTEGWNKVKVYSDTKQRTDDLFDEYIRLVDGFLPRAFVAENVPGFLGGQAVHYRDWVIGSLEALGYRVAALVLDASAHGVPQKRRRAIIIGIRRDVGVNPFDAYPLPSADRYSIREAISDLRIADEEKTDCDFRGYAIHSEWEKMPEGEFATSGKYFSLVRPDPDLPCPTITATAGSVGAASVTHPDEPRKFALRELRRLCGFPDDFILTGNYQQAAERLGRAVPPPLMRAVAARLAEVIA